MAMKCSNVSCYPIVKPTDLYCVKCGSILKQQDICRTCRSNLHPSDKFCGICGMKVLFKT